MRVENCPKKLNHCPEQACPIYPCWAYDKHMDNSDRQKRERNSGWE